MQSTPTITSTCFLASLMMLSPYVSAANDAILDWDISDYLNQRIGVNLYLSGLSDITQRSEFAALSYDISSDMSIIMGTSVSEPSSFQYLDLSLHNPWTLWSWQSSVEIGVGRYINNDCAKHRISQSISLDYGLDEFFSLQILLKRFSTTLHKLRGDESMIAMGIGMRV